MLIPMKQMYPSQNVGAIFVFVVDQEALRCLEDDFVEYGWFGGEQGGTDKESDCQEEEGDDGQVMG